MKKLKPREWFLIAFPTLLILGALFTQLRPDATRALLWRFFPPHRFYVEKIEFPQLTPYEVSRGYDTKVLVVLNHGGERPAWWNKQNSSMARQIPNQLGEMKNGQWQAIPRNLAQISEPHYDMTRDRYLATCYLALSRIPPSDEPLLLRSQTAIGLWDNQPESAVVPFDAVVRTPQQIIKVPPVSRQPAIRLDRVLVTYFSDADAKRLRDDVEVTAIFSRVQSVPLFTGNQVSSPILYDDKGRELPVGLSGGMLLDIFQKSQKHATATKPDTLYSATYGFRLGAKRASRITLKNSETYRGTWPLEFSIDLKPTTPPIRKTRTIQTSFTQRAAPIKP